MGESALSPRELFEALRSIEDLLASFGGHPQACGLTLRDGVDPAAFAQRLEAYAAERLAPEQLVPTLAIDAELSLDRVDWDLVEWLKRLGPFGVGNPTPRFLARGLEVKDVQTMGNGGKHCRLYVRQVGNDESRMMNQESAPPDSRFQIPDSRHKLVCFRYADICPAIRTGDVVDVVYELDVNEWNGNREIQMKVVDVRAARQCQAEESQK